MPRSTNLMINVTLLLRELVKENVDVLITNSIKPKIWKVMRSKISALGYAYTIKPANTGTWANIKERQRKN